MYNFWPLTSLEILYLNDGYIHMHYIMWYLMPETSFQKSTKEMKSDVISNKR